MSLFDVHGPCTVRGEMIFGWLRASGPCRTDECAAGREAGGMRGNDGYDGMAVEVEDDVDESG